MTARKVDSGVVAHSERQGSGEVTEHRAAVHARRPFDLSAILSTTLTEESQRRRATPKHEMTSRRDDSDRERRLDERQLEKWRKAVTKRDGMICRWCKCEVIATIERLPKQAQTHHAVPREHRPTRYDPRVGIRLCGTCHDRVTGTIGEKAIIIASKTFTLDGREYPDMSKPVRFRKVVAKPMKETA